MTPQFLKMTPEYKKNDWFVLSSGCKVVKGASRSVIIDTLRNDVQIITNQYYDLIQQLNRQRVYQVASQIDEASLNNFYDFLNYMLDHEFGFLTATPELFPEAPETVHDDHLSLRDAIVEIDPHHFDSEGFATIVQQLDSLNCLDLQLRFLATVDLNLLTDVIKVVDATSIQYLEVHLADIGKMEQETLFRLIEDHPTLANVFVYGSARSYVVDCNIYQDNYHHTLLGKVFYIQSPLDINNCGVISFHHLNFDNIHSHNLHKKFNGCLYKKLTIDRFGNIKNCPSMGKSFGNSKDKSLKEILNTDEFQVLWMIKKDDIAVCKDCEFRYSCSDCRAFIADRKDIYSKPLKCGYNPYSNEWEKWSSSPLQKYEPSTIG